VSFSRIVLPLVALTCVGTPETVSVGLSHVPIAVVDLDHAADDFARLGFALKPGRPHDDGIRNRHVKFHDGTEIELITAAETTDALTGYYRRFLARGEGGAFLSLDTRPADLAARQVAAAGLPARIAGGYVDFPYDTALGYIFFAGLNQSPTDRPEHFAHRNGASGLVGVTIEGRDFEPERRLFRALRLTEAACGAAGAACVTLADGATLRLVPRADGPRVRIAGLDVRINGDGDVTRVLDGAHVTFVRHPAGITGEGPVTHGVTLTFVTGASREPR
jgi:hypothetical protein